MIGLNDGAGGHEPAVIETAEINLMISPAVLLPDDPDLIGLIFFNDRREGRGRHREVMSFMTLSRGVTRGKAEAVVGVLISDDEAPVLVKERRGRTAGQNAAAFLGA
jgi:hypothetical protein